MTDASPRPPYDLEPWRRQVPILERLLPMNHCTQAPQTTATRAAAEHYLESWRRNGVDWDAWMDEVDRARREFARLIGAESDEVAVTTSLSAAAAAVASAIDWSGPRNRVVASAAEFPTVGHVWLAHQKYGAKVRWLPVEDGQVDAEGYHDLVDGRTAVVSACHAYYQNGFKQDLEKITKIAHDAGALVFVDAYQTLGIHQVDVKALGVDFLACGNLKFLMGIPGIAFLYVKDVLAERLEPALTGWLGRARPFDFRVRELDWAPNAHRFDTGTPPILAAYVARAGMAMLNEIGPRQVQAWTDVLSARLLEGAAARGLEVHGPRDVRRKTPLLAIVCPDELRERLKPKRPAQDGGSGWTSRERIASDLVEEHLLERGILASARGPAIRLTPHFYNTVEDVDRALDAVARVFGR